MKRKIIYIILVVLALSGISLLLYPTVSNYINTLNQSKAISRYNDVVSSFEKEEYDKIISSAMDYNSALSSKPTNFKMSAEEIKRYEKQLSFSDNGVMGFIDIPKLNCSIPIFHGTEEAVLQSGVGHLEWSSLPVGGVSTHCVLSGHRGLPSAKLFSDMDLLNEGDTFTINVLNEVLTYEIDSILIVEPSENKALRIVKGMDYCTLVTCTPYGVNSHRMLVRGHRVSNAENDSTKISSDALLIDYIIVSSFIAIPTLTIFLITLIIKTIRASKKSGRKNREN